MTQPIFNLPVPAPGQTTKELLDAEVNRVTALLYAAIAAGGDQAAIDALVADIEAIRAAAIEATAADRIQTGLDRQAAESAAGNAATDANAQIAPNVQAAQSAAQTAEVARDGALQAAGSEGYFATVAEAEAALADGDVFWTVDAPAAEIVYYQIDSGAAVEIDGARLKAAALFDWLSRTGPSDFALPMADKDGFVRAGLRADGSFQVERLLVASDGGDEISVGGARLATSESDEFEFFFADRDGFVVAGMDETGGGLGSEAGASVDVHNVAYMFTEPFDDPSQSLVLTWVSDSPGGDLMEYRNKGAGSWIGVKSQRTRKMGPLDWWLHSVAIEGLAFANVYEARFPGADLRDDFWTTPRRNPVIAAGSDFQSTRIIDAPELRLLAESIRAQGADIFLHPGDHINDDGRKAPLFPDDEIYWQRWFDYMQTLSQIMRKNGGVIPLAGLVGNHEARKADPSSDPAQAESNGSEMDGADGTIGQIEDVMSWSYWDATPTKFVDSAATISIGEDVFIVGLNTDHSEDLEPQIAWLIDQLEAAYPKYRHLIVMGHYPAFYPAEGVRNFTAPARRLRNIMYPQLEQFADKLRVYLCGHAHVFAITPPLRVLFDDALTPEQNDERYTEDASLGIVQIGTGPMQVGPRFPERGDDTSAFDGSNMFRAAMGRDENQDIVTNGPEPIDNQTIDTAWHYWLMDFSDTQFRARGFGQHNLPFFTYTKEL